jgi:hypothetical protein
MELKERNLSEESKWMAHGGHSINVINLAKSFFLHTWEQYSFEFFIFYFPSKLAFSLFIWNPKADWST